jgi:hypothetical protein
MEFAIRLVLLVFTDVFRKSVIPFIMVTVLLSLFCGAIATFSGGAFWRATGYSAGACLIIGLVIAGVVSISAVFSRRGW